ncbi:hypothetical protein OE88DRAFT_1244169 [Heliocybe sulcata]|uniref:Uncharacterized protein n=1 Tax=Heliocybe sulcata TaxID=5364 RepID=A0A5C3NA91_9AGAM|nr:hypothetical protein OE88DRAFT_1244169 [Heliocybe sulcata]
MFQWLTVYVGSLPLPIRCCLILVELYVCWSLLVNLRRKYMQGNLLHRRYFARTANPSHLEAGRPFPVDRKAPSKLSNGSRTKKNRTPLHERIKQLDMKKVAAWIARRPPLLEVNPGAIDIAVEGLDSPDEESGLRQPLDIDTQQGNLLDVKAQREKRKALRDGTNWKELTYRTPYDGKRYTICGLNAKVNKPRPMTIDCRQAEAAWLGDLDTTKVDGPVRRTRQRGCVANGFDYAYALGDMAPMKTNVPYAQVLHQTGGMSSRVQEKATEDDEGYGDGKKELYSSDSDSSFEGSEEREWVDTEASTARMWLSDF